jgi:hypothetical protein
VARALHLHSLCRPGRVSCLSSSLHSLTIPSPLPPGRHLRHICNAWHTHFWFVTAVPMAAGQKKKAAKARALSPEARCIVVPSPLQMHDSASYHRDETKKVHGGGDVSCSLTCSFPAALRCCYPLLGPLGHRRCRCRCRCRCCSHQTCVAAQGRGRVISFRAFSAASKKGGLRNVAPSTHAGEDKPCEKRSTFSTFFARDPHCRPHRSPI